MMGKVRQGTQIKILIVCASFMCGLFYTWSACLASLALLYFLFENRKTGFFKNDVFCVCCLIAASYLISTFWAVDKGMAPIGFAKFLALPLFAAVFLQTPIEERKAVLTVVPYIGAVMTVLSTLLGKIAVWESFFYVNHRLSGFFQYSNTFALFLLVGIIVVLFQEAVNLRDWICAAILIVGIILSGSRTTFFLLVATVAYYLLFSRNKTVRIVIAALLGLATMGSVAYVLVSGSTDSIGRFLTASTSSSTLLGRLLYYKDALPVILRHPFGLGYLGYHYLQGSFQTGVYSVRFIHNELLQLLLDVGWIPATATAIVILRHFFARATGIRSRVIIVAIILHSMMDFDFQFLIIGFVLIAALLEGDSFEPARKMPKVTSAGLRVLAVACLYFGAASLLESMGNDIAALKLYPNNTDIQVRLLQSAETAEDMEEYANAILQVNKSAFIAYDAKAMVAYSNADFTEVITNKEKAIALNRYEKKEYEDYCAMLSDGIQLYEYYGDNYSKSICQEHLRSIPIMLQKLEQDTSEIAWKINDKPDFALSQDCTQMIQQFGN